MSTPGPLDPRQRHVGQFETVETHLDGRQAQIHTSMPGQIVSFDASKMTATVQPAIQGIQTKIDGSRVTTTISPIHDVPVHFPSGGGFTLTFPVKPGDECLLVFMERSMDNWFQHGGTQLPSDRRMHDINDCVAYVGLRSQPNVISGISTTGVQLRSDAGTDFVEVDNGNLTVQTVGLLRFKAGSISFEAPTVAWTGTSGATGAMNINANITTTGTLTNNGVNVSSSHKHGGITRGGALSDAPT
jgi:hypothetical protein